MGAPEILDYLERCKTLVLPELRRIVPEGPLAEILYDRMLEYPRRSAKALRPALCIATCRALGGGLEAALPTAAVLELYHNAFLVHDDIEDGSELRRDAPTLHMTFGIPIAINIGDAMLALALTPLLDNTRTVGLGRALRVLRIVADMARISAEGQALELEWIRAQRFDLTDADYVDMVERKTGHYSFVAPLLAGAVLAGFRDDETAVLRDFGRELGVAFQIQDDVLNLTEDYGKERDGDLYEGKHTLILLHLLRTATPAERERVIDVLAKPRMMFAGSQSPLRTLRSAVDEAKRGLDLSVAGALEGAFECVERALTPPTKTAEHVAMLKSLALRYGSVAHAHGVAREWAARAAMSFDALRPRLRPSRDAEFLHDLVAYVVDRSR